MADCPAVCHVGLATLPADLAKAICVAVALKTGSKYSCTCGKLPAFALHQRPGKRFSTACWYAVTALIFSGLSFMPVASIFSSSHLPPVAPTPLSRSDSQVASPDRTPAICLLGPTASGKTRLAIEIVQRLPCDIINVDSAQIYRDMNIGTGKPDAETLRRAPHRLIDILDPAQAYSVSQFRLDALREMCSVRDSGRIPLLVGGTMMYFKALRDGLATMPAADEVVRARILASALESGWSAVHEQLRLIDPESAQRIHPNDPQRLQRALEVYLISGKSLSAHHRDEVEQETEALPFDLHFFSIQPGLRSVLHEKIATRFRQMVSDGLVDEVASLFARGDLHAGMPSMRAVGYRQVWQYVAGELSFDAMLERGIIATRQLAKRQVTWMRSWEDLRNFDSENPETLDLVLKSIERIAI